MNRALRVLRVLVVAAVVSSLHALAEWASMNPAWPVVVREPNIAAQEVAARLGTSRWAGREQVEAARLFAGPLYPTADALAAGDLDGVKARIVIAALGGVAGQVAVSVQERVLPGAKSRTPAQLRADLRRALIAVDPVDAAQRTARAVGGRRVCRPKVLAEEMAGIWAVLPAATAS